MEIEISNMTTSPVIGQEADNLACSITPGRDGHAKTTNMNGSEDAKQIVHPYIERLSKHLSRIIELTNFIGSEMI